MLVSEGEKTLTVAGQTGGFGSKGVGEGAEGFGVGEAIGLGAAGQRQSVAPQSQQAMEPGHICPVAQQGPGDWQGSHVIPYASLKKYATNPRFR